MDIGMAIGGYEDDYAASGVPFAGRGARFDAMLGDMTRVWAGENRGTAGATPSDHYAGKGADSVSRVLAAALTSVDAVREAVAAYAGAGCDELILFPCDPDSDQVRLPAEALA